MGIFDNYGYGFNPNQIQSFTYNQPRMTVPNPPVINSPVNQQPVDLIKVHGMDGVYRYPTPPNSRVPMFDDSDDIMYIKQTDSNGYATILKCSFQIIEDKPKDYVTIDEFNKFKEEILNGKQSVWEFSDPTGGPKQGSGRNGQSKKHGSDAQVSK